MPAAAKDNLFGRGGGFDMSPEEEALLLQEILKYEADNQEKTEVGLLWRPH